MSNILVIKHGALGDIVLATAPFQAIREHHKGAHITLLTTAPYADMLRESGYFDEIWVDKRPKPYQLLSFLKLLKTIRKGNFARIYDLQSSERTSWYFKFMREPRPEWVGAAEGASHHHGIPKGAMLHSSERQRKQLEVAGIFNLPAPNIDWLTSDLSRFKLPEHYVLIAAGGSSHRPGKRWPASHYGELCEWLVKHDIMPVLIGTKAEASVISTIEALCPQAINLIGRTDFADVAELARHAKGAIGNDTGPIHLIAVTGCPTLVLFSQFSNPTLCAPRGKNVMVMQESCLAKLQPETVIKKAQAFLQAKA